MRQAYRILPVYSGDVSGVCSALYELGGMVVPMMRRDGTTATV